MARVAGCVLTAVLAVTAIGFTSTARSETVYGVTINDFLVSFNSNTPGSFDSGVAINGLESGEHVVAMDVQPGTNVLYALGSNGRLYTLDQTNGAASYVGRDFGFALSGANGGMTFDRTNGHLHLVTSSDHNMIIDAARGESAQVGKSISFPAGDPSSGMDPNVTQISSTVTGHMYGIDTGLDTLVSFGSMDSGNVMTIGSLGVDATESGGFAVSDNGLAYAAFRQPGSNNSTFYFIDLATGHASPIGELDGSSGYFTSLALAPEPASMALVTLGAVVLSLRRTKR
jgi:hypothetical protein